MEIQVPVHEKMSTFLQSIQTILVHVTIYGRLLIGRDGHINQSEACIGSRPIAPGTKAPRTNATADTSPPDISPLANCPPCQ